MMSENRNRYVHIIIQGRNRYTVSDRLMKTKKSGYGRGGKINNMDKTFDISLSESTCQWIVTSRYHGTKNNTSFVIQD